MKKRKFPSWLPRLSKAIDHCWHNHGPCAHIHFRYSKKPGYWHVIAAPVWQEMYGGKNDGSIVWTGFVFEVSDFLRLPGVFIEKFAVATKCGGCSQYPKYMAKGKYRGHPVLIEIYLEPIEGSDTVEIIDTLKKQVREAHAQETRKKNG